MPARQRAQREAIYLNFLMEQANHALLDRQRFPLDAEGRFHYPIDPQGRLLMDVTLTEGQQKELMEQMNKERSAGSAPFESLAEALGRTPTPTTTVSLDITNNPDLSTHFYQKIQAALAENDSNYPVADAMRELRDHSKGSIIPLQQELHFHLALAARVYQKAIPDKLGNKGQEIQKAHQGAMLELNKEILKVYAKAIKSARKNGSLNMAVLNKELDKGRQELTRLGHKLLRQHLVKNTGIVLDKNDLKKLKKQLAEETTASPNDVLHTSREQHLITLIAGSESTAHHRKAGALFAHRQIISSPMNEEGLALANMVEIVTRVNGREFIVHENPRLQIRTPSPVVKKGLASDGDYISDVAEKLNAVREYYDLEQYLIPGKLPRAFIYNSYTAFHNSSTAERLVSDPGNKNRQTQSARHILLGAHQYNKDQFLIKNSEGIIIGEKPNPIFCLVQNISVNGFGNTLGYGSGNDLREETTLMAELALMHTLYDSSSATQKRQIEGIMNRYKFFLKSDTFSLGFFSRSPDGIAAKGLINQLKGEWQKEVSDPPINNIQQNAQLALKNLVARDLHHDHQYSKLVQALSVFCERASIGGCKSGNERAQAINGRVAVLEHLSHHPTDMELLAEHLAQLASGQGDVSKIAQDLNKALNEEYNKFGLQGAAAVISLLDQGGAAKVKPKEGFHVDTNFAEESASVMTNLHQKHASDMQAHKGLIKHMKEAWEGVSFRSALRDTYNALKESFSSWGPLAPIIAGGGSFFSSIFLLFRGDLERPIQEDNEKQLNHYAKQTESHKKMQDSGLNPSPNASKTSTEPAPTIAAPPVSRKETVATQTQTPEDDRNGPSM